MQLKWLDWARRIQTIAQAGLTYSTDIYDLERYDMLKKICVEIMSEYSDVESEKIAKFLFDEKGYVTPKVDVRAAVFSDNKILMVQERGDKRWSLPGGWTDLGLSPGEVVVKEIHEETGLSAKATRLLAILDKKYFLHPPSPFYVYKIFILCEITGGTMQGGTETIDVGFFEQDKLPELSPTRITKEQIDLMFEYLKNPEKEATFN